MRIDVYLEGGKSPFLRWLDGLPVAHRALVERHLVRLSLGQTAALKSLGGSLVEYRIRGQLELRLYLGRVQLDDLLLLWGGLKKHQKKDLLRARTYWSNHLSQRNHGLE